MLLAAAMFDFGLNRWVTLLGATAAAIFGGTFLLQGVANLTEIAALDWLAFDILGQQLERILPDVVYVWFAALLLTGSTGFSRLVGWVVVPLLFGLELAILVGAQFGIDVPFIRADDLRAVRLAAARVREAPLVARRGADGASRSLARRPSLPDTIAGRRPASDLGGRGSLLGRTAAASCRHAPEAEREPGHGATR